MLAEAVGKLSKEEFLKMVAKLYDEGDDKVISRIADAAYDIRIEEIVEKIFKTKAPNAVAGAQDILSNKIKGLNISAFEKAELTQAILDGTAYDIIKLTKKSRLQPTSVDSCVNKSFKGASQILPWYVSWNASVSGARGKAATEIFMITAGKNGAVPDKGDAIVDGVKIESKSYAATFGSEYSISGKQGSMFPITKAFDKRAIAFLKKNGATMKQSTNVVFGSATSSGKKSVESEMRPSMERFIKALLDAGTTHAEIEKFLILTTNAVFGARGLSLQMFAGDKFLIENFLAVWHACAFSAYKKEEGFDIMSIFNRKLLQVITFNTAADILKVAPRMSHKSFSHIKGFGQNDSIGGFEYK